MALGAQFPNQILMLLLKISHLQYLMRELHLQEINLFSHQYTKTAQETLNITEAHSQMKQDIHTQMSREGHLIQT